MLRATLLLLTCSLFTLISVAQNPVRISDEIDFRKKQGADFKEISIFTKIKKSQINQRADVAYESFVVDDINYRAFLKENAENIDLQLEYKNQPLKLSLVQVEILAPGFQVTTSLGATDFTYEKPLYYQGVVEGEEQSIVAISFSQDDVIGIIDIEGDENLVFGSLSGTTRFQEFVLYDINQVDDTPDFGCELIEGVAEYLPDSRTAIETRSTNCVNIYFECDYNMFSEEGTVQATVDKMTGIFNVVSTLYANDGITVKISQIKVWNTPDNYIAGSNTAETLYDFRSKVPNFNGDLAHLVSRGAPSGGGVAFLSGLCNSYSYGYSYIYSNYSQFPTYSWTVNVITHELGHNLSSNHTHDCAWNGNSTAIDGCGPTAGYSSGCDAPLPTNGGTIMSYCHLIGSVGINFNNGFGPQPATRILNYVNNASCLSACVDCTSEGLSCDDGDPCTSNDVYDAFCNCAGTPEADSDGDGICDINDQCPGFDDGLIGTSCNDGDPCTENDVYTSSCMCEGTFADSDNDGVCDAEDVCPGFNDAVDSDNDGIPDGCDGNCDVIYGNFPASPLTHSGGGSSQTTLVFDRVSSNINFTISNINARNSGNPNNRFIERVEVTYLDENNNVQTYGSFTGSQGSTYGVLISDLTKSVTVNLSDAYDGRANGLSVNLGSVEYCEDNSICNSPDSDGDGVCDAEDVCPGYDDAIDSDGDGIPDGCDNCNDINTGFSSSNLSHTGTGNSSITESFGQVIDQVSFNISSLGSRTNGKSNRRYIDEVTVTYVNQAGQTQTYGTFSGTSESSVNVLITSASAVTVSLTDSYDGNADGVTLDIGLSGISGCVGSAAAPISGTFSGLTDVGNFNFHPNPTRGILHIDYQSEIVENNHTVYLRFYDLSGKMVKESQYQVSDGHLNRKINVNDLTPSVYFVQLQDGDSIISKKLIIMNR